MGDSLNNVMPLSDDTTLVDGMEAFERLYG